MTSTAASLFAWHGVPTLMEVFGDESMSIAITTGDEQTIRLPGPVGIVRRVTATMEVDDMGTLHRVSRRSVVVPRDDRVPWDGLQSPQLISVWTLEDKDGQQTEWSVDSTEGRGIEIGDSLVVVHLMSTSPMNYSGPRYRM